MLTYPEKLFQHANFHLLFVFEKNSTMLLYYRINTNHFSSIHNHLTNLPSESGVTLEYSMIFT
jgi:hypothetical protein